MVYLLHQAVHKCENSKLSGKMGKAWHNSGIAIESLKYFKAFPVISSSQNFCVAFFTNASTLLEF